MAGNDTTVTAKFVADVGNFTKGTEEVVASTKAVESSTSGLTSSLGGVKDAATEAGAGIQTAGESSGTAASKIGEAGKSAKEAGPGLMEMAGGFAQGVQQVAQFVQLAAQFISAIAQTHDEILDTANAFVTFSKNGELASASLKALASTSAASDFGAKAVDDTAKKMEMMGHSTADTIPVINKAADGIAAMGGSAKNLEPVVTQMEKIKTEGKVTESDINSLVNNGLPAWKALADGMGVSITEAQRRVKAGAVDGSNAFNDMMKGLDKYAGAANTQSKDLGSEWARLTDNFKSSFGPVLDQLGKFLDSLNNIIEALGKVNGLLQTLSGLALSLNPITSMIGQANLISSMSGGSSPAGAAPPDISGVAPATWNTGSTIPGHAAGGNNLSGLSVIGEDGPELFDPAGGSMLSNASSSSLLGSLPAIGGGSGPVTIQVHLDSQMIAEQTMPHIAPMIRVMTGRRQ